MLEGTKSGAQSATAVASPPPGNSSHITRDCIRSDYRFEAIAEDAGAGGTVAEPACGGSLYARLEPFFAPRLEKLGDFCGGIEPGITFSVLKWLNASHRGIYMPTFAYMSGIISNSVKMSDCTFCERLRKRGRFPRKCVHQSESNNSSPLSHAATDEIAELVSAVVQKQQDYDAVQTENGIESILPRPDSFSTFFPKVRETLQPNFYEALNHRMPARIEMIATEERHYEVHVAILSIPGAMAILTGMLAAFNLSIKSGSAVVRKRPQFEVLLAIFEVESVATVGEFDSVHQELLRRELVAMWQCLQRDRSVAFDKLLSRVFRDKFASLQASTRAFGRIVLKTPDDDPITAASDDVELRDINSKGDGANNPRPRWMSPLEVTAEDTIGFIFFLSTALAMRHVQIDGVSIGGDHGLVHDKFFVHSSKDFGDEKQLNREIKSVVAMLQQFTQMLSFAPNPAQALRNFDSLLSRLSSESTNVFDSMMEEKTLKRLAVVLGSSSFLWESFLWRDESYLEALKKEDIETLRSPTKSQYVKDLKAIVDAVFDDEDVSTHALRVSISRFKCHQLFRIYIRHLLCPQISMFSEDLNNLAEVVVQTGIDCAQRLHSNPWPVDTDGQPYRFSMFGLGKFGGREMGFASDLDLMCVFGSERQEDESSASKQFFSAFVKDVIEILIDSSSHLRDAFDIDLRLRPHGAHGLFATSWSSYRMYYSSEGQYQQFERQALVRLRFVAGDIYLGSLVEKHRDDVVYSGAPFDLEYALHLRRRQRTELCKRGTRNVKYGDGGIIDIEYGVQYLQIIHGFKHLEVRQPSISEGLTALAKCGAITQALSNEVLDAHTFMRGVIDALRVANGYAHDLVLPELDVSTGEFCMLAKRMGFWGSAAVVQKLVDRINNSMKIAAEFYASVLQGSQDEPLSLSPRDDDEEDADVQSPQSAHELADVLRSGLEIVRIKRSTSGI